MSHDTHETPERGGIHASGEEEAREALRARVRITLRPVGAPTALGLFGLAAATLLLSGLQLGWVEPAESTNVAIVLVTFALLAQALAAVFAFLARDGVEGTAMGVLGLSWLVTGLMTLTTAPGEISDALGLFLLFAAIALGIAGMTALSSKIAVGLVFLMAALRFLITAMYELTGENGWQDLAGAVGLALFGLAIYVAWAALLEDAQGKTVLPLGRRGDGRAAMESGLLEQVRQAPNEAGVRRTL